MEAHTLNPMLSAIIPQAIYSDVFDWLVGVVNAKTEGLNDGCASWIGVLDIFGFEILAVNSFEQANGRESVE